MSSNRLLLRLSRADSRLLEPHLEAVDLPVRKQLEARKRRVTHAYFVQNGVASVVANGNRPIEVGMIGREGMTGLSAVLDTNNTNPAVHDTFTQIGGNGLRMPVDSLLQAVDASVSLHRVLLRFAHAFLMQTMQTALSNGRSNLEERLARWLLMSADRTHDSALPLTHEFLAT